MSKEFLLFVLVAVFVFFAALNLQVNSAFLLGSGTQTCSSSANFISTPYLADTTVFDGQGKELVVLRIDD
jgi:hypothetical protein